MPGALSYAAPVWGAHAARVFSRCAPRLPRQRLSLSLDFVMPDSHVSSRKPVILGPGEGRSYPMGRIAAVFKAGTAETESRYSISEWWLEPHTQGPGAHSHEKDDIFYVIEGAMSVLVGEEWTHATRGSFILIPGGVTHTFENRGDTRAGVLNLAIPRAPSRIAWRRSRNGSRRIRRGMRAFDRDSLGIMEESLSSRDRILSLAEFALGGFIVIAHNVLRIVPNEVPILLFSAGFPCACATADGKRRD